MSHQKYPESEGWIRGTYKLVRDTLLSEAEIKKIASFGKPEDYEFGPISQNGKTLKVIFREHNWQDRCRKKTAAAA